MQRLLISETPHQGSLLNPKKLYFSLFCMQIPNDYFFLRNKEIRKAIKIFREIISWNFQKKGFSCKIRHHDVWLSFHRMSGRGFERCIDSIQRLAFPNFLATWSNQNENLKGLFLKLDWKSKDFINEFWNIFWSQKILWNWPFLLKRAQNCEFIWHFPIFHINIWFHGKVQT